MTANPTIQLESQKRNGENTDWFEVLPTLADSDADRTSGLFNNPYGIGMLLYVKTANEANTAGFTPNLMMKDPNGAAVILWTATTEITADGTYIYLLHPAAPDGMGTGVTESAGVAVPGEWYVFLEYTTGSAGTDTIDTEVYACYI